MDGQTSQAQLTFSGHINELRKRLALPGVMLLVGGMVGYAFHAKIIDFIKAPLNQDLYYTTPAGGFNFIMKVCFILGITLAVPTLIYGVVSFIEPAVEKKISRKLISMVTFMSLALGLIGGLFAYYIVLPMSLHFFSGIKLDGISPLISADDYLNFALTCILSFILLFQLPLLVLFINHIKPMSPRKLLKYERHVIVGSLAVALVLPFTFDPLSQFLIAVPIIVLYNLSILFIWVANRKLRKAQKLEAKPVEIVKEGPKPPTITPASQPAPLPKPKPSLRPSLAPQRKRPVLDVVSSPLQTRNFLDLRPSK
jgi:sec-independent protein translocase protein TatC